MTPFRRPGPRYARTPEPETPYQRAGQVWDLRLGGAYAEARGWRRMALAAFVLAAATTGSLVWTTMRGSVTPWVVEVDALGRAQAVAPASAGWRPTDPQVAWHLAQFVKDVRSLPADPVVLRENWLRAYDHATGAGAQALNGYARAEDPFARLGREQVTVEVASVVRASPSSFRVEWVERRFVAGQETDQARWTAILRVELRPPRSPEELRRNPLGVFVTALDWSKELS